MIPRAVCERRKKNSIAVSRATRPLSPLSSASIYRSPAPVRAVSVVLRRLFAPFRPVPLRFACHPSAFAFCLLHATGAYLVDVSLSTLCSASSLLSMLYGGILGGTSARRRVSTEAGGSGCCSSSAAPRLPSAWWPDEPGNRPLSWLDATQPSANRPRTGKRDVRPFTSSCTFGDGRLMYGGLIESRLPSRPRTLPTWTRRRDRGF